MRTGSLVSKAEAFVPSAYSTEFYSRSKGDNYANINDPHTPCFLRNRWSR